MKIQFSEEHLHRFRDASLDVNPLHLSEDYARRTSYGERVVYGVLGVVASLGQIEPPAEKTPSAIRVDFKGALRLDVTYTLQASWDASGKLKASLMDGSSPVMRMSVEFREGHPELIEMPGEGTATLNSARVLSDPDLHSAPHFRGTYSPPGHAYQALVRACHVDRVRWGDAFLVTLLCTSYLTGMELPGERAAYSGLKAAILPVSPALPAQYSVSLASLDERFALAQSRFELRGNAGVYSSGEIGAIVRSPITRDHDAISNAGTGRFAGKTAVLIGASRGLGAAMALELAAEGGTVIGVYARSAGDARSVSDAAAVLPGRVFMEQGDAADPAWCSALKDRVRQEYGKVDLLICNAAPPIQSLRVEEASYTRLQSYLHRGFALVGAPLSTFLDLVSQSAGGVLLISSSAMDNPPAAWPHYIAMKGSVESLVRAAAADYRKARFWIARPAKIETELINTPMGRDGAEKPHLTARRILSNVSESTPPGIVHFIR